MTTQTINPVLTGDPSPAKRFESLEVYEPEAEYYSDRLQLVRASLINLRNVTEEEVRDLVIKGTGDVFFNRGLFQSGLDADINPWLKVLCDKATQKLLISEVIEENGRRKVIPYTFEVSLNIARTSTNMEFLAYFLCQPENVRAMYCPGYFFTDKETFDRDVAFFTRSALRLVELLKLTLEDMESEILSGKVKLGM